MLSDHEEYIDFPVEASSSLDGAAAVAGSITADDDAQAGEEFRRALAESGLSADGSRGLLDQASRLLRRFRSRKLVADLGTHEVKLDWLGFHVPKGGTGSLQLGTSSEQDATLKLKLMGFGGGTRQHVTVSARRDFGERRNCFYLGSEVPVHVLSYAEDGADEANVLQVDVGEPTGTYIRTSDECPLCFAAGADKPSRARPTGKGWDLRMDDGGLVETMSWELSTEWNVEMGLDIPLLGSPLKAALEMSRSFTSSCVATYGFPAGSSFTSYELIGSRLNLPFWETR